MGSQRAKSLFFFFNDTATTEIYTLSLHDALPISYILLTHEDDIGDAPRYAKHFRAKRSEEHTSELQSRSDLVCRLLLEKKKKKIIRRIRFICPRWLERICTSMRLSYLMHDEATLA